MADAWRRVPEVLHWAVAASVDGRSLATMGAVNRSMRRWAHEEALWSALVGSHDQAALRRAARPIARLELEEHLLEAYQEETLRLVVIGAAPGAGTTSLVHRFLRRAPRERPPSSAAIRIQHACVGLRPAGARRLLRIVEDSDARRARRVRIIEEGRYFGHVDRRAMYEGAGVVVVVDVSSPSAVADAARAFDIIGRDTGKGEPPRVVLCATKTDLFHSAATAARLDRLASAVGARSVRASARDGTGVDTAFLLPFVEAFAAA